MFKNLNLINNKDNMKLSNQNSEDIVFCNTTNNNIDILIEKDKSDNISEPSSSSSTLHSPSSTAVNSPTLSYADPREMYSQRRKTLILFTIAFAGLIGPIGSTIYYPAMKIIEKDLNTTGYLVNLSVSAFMLTMAIMPLAWGVFSDVYGRRKIYLVSLFISFVASVGCAFSKSIAPLLIFRGIQGIGCSSVNSVGAGTISDVFLQKERGRAMGIYLLGALVGPAVGPILGGVMTDYIGWQSIFWLLAAISFISLVMIYFALPETKIPTPPGEPEPKKSLNPVKPLAYLRFRNVTQVIFMVCMIYASYYSINISLPNDYGDKYGFSSTVTGFMYFGIGLGNILGSLYGGRYSDYILKKYNQKNNVKKIGNGQLPSEGRLRSIVPGICMFPLGLLLHGWSIHFVWPWYISTFAQFVVGFGMMFVFSSTSTYLVELFPENSAAIMSVNNFSRFSVSTVAITVYQPVVEVINTGWYFTTFTVLSLLAALGTFWVYRYGTAYRMQRKPWNEQNPSFISEIKVETGNEDDTSYVKKRTGKGIEDEELTADVNTIDLNVLKREEKNENTITSMDKL